MKYRNIFIDLDDTLWDIHQNGKVCLKQIYHDYGYNEFYPTFEDYYNVYMPHNVDLWTQYREGKIKKDFLIVERFLSPVRKFGIDDEGYARKLSEDFLNRTTKQKKLVDGAIELLEYLKPKYNIHILSNGFREVQYKKLENSGLMPYISKVILSEDADANKPHPDIFTYALVNTNSKRSESIMIGDAYDADIVGAYNSKIDQIWFNPKNEPSPDFVPTYIVQTLQEIKNIL